MIGFRLPTRTARRGFARALAATAVSAGLILGATVPAHASASYKQGCFVITPTTGITTQTVYGYNTCSYTTGFQVYAMWPTPGIGSQTKGEGCIRVAPRATGGYKWTKGRKFAGTGSC
jgi:hypothetical protein